MNDIQQARGWADDMRRVESACGGVRQDALVAAELIQSLPDQWVDAEKVRGLIKPYIESETAVPALWHLVKDLEALLPPPSPRTLADMTPEERDTQKWMQAKVFPTASTPGIITGVDEYAHSAIILFADGMAKNVPWAFITPLPGPKLEWPSLSVSDESEPVSVETEDVTEESDPAQETQPEVKILTTVEDYEKAAENTIVREEPANDRFAYEKSDGYWHGCNGFTPTSAAMAGIARTVLWEPKP